MAITLSGDGIARANLAADVIDGTKIEDDAVGTEHLANAINTDIAAKLPLAGGTMTGALNFGDNVKIRLGTGNDYELYHDGTHTYMDNNTGALFMRNNGSVIIEDLSGNNIIRGIDGGAVDLYHDGNSKLTTSATGVTVTGAIAGATNLGKILQVKSGHQASAYTYSASTWHDVLLLTLDITPSATSSKILIQVDMNIGTTGTGGNLYGHGRVLRDSTAIGLGNSAGNAQQQVGWSISNDDGYTKIYTPSWHYLDSPNTTSQVTYKVQVWGNDVITLNRNGENNSHATVGRTSSNLTIMEIGA